MEYWTIHRGTKQWLNTWHGLTSAATWQNLVDVRKTYPHADPVPVKSRRTVTVFNVCGDNHRLITAIHYNAGIVYVLMLMKHPDYTRGHWKKQL